MALTLQQLKIVKEYMRANLDRDIGLRELSDSIGLSAFHFSRAFKSQTGIPPGQYFTKMRVERAQDLLSQTSLPIPEIAVAVGMWSQSHLTHVLKRVTGVTPAEYRRQTYSGRGKKK
jgi:AraC family transcriptional regulator